MAEPTQRREIVDSLLSEGGAVGPVVYLKVVGRIAEAATEAIARQGGGPSNPPAWRGNVFLVSHPQPLTMYRPKRYAGQIAMSSAGRYMARIKGKTLNLRIEAELKAAAEKAAADDRRSLTSLIENLLTAYLRKKGYLKGA